MTIILLPLSVQWPYSPPPFLKRKQNSLFLSVPESPMFKFSTNLNVLQPREQPLYTPLSLRAECISGRTFLAGGELPRHFQETVTDAAALLLKPEILS